MRADNQRISARCAAVMVLVLPLSPCLAKDERKIPVPVEVWRDVSTKELTIAGIGKAKDGDTLSIDGVFDVRLIGIDALERKQTCSMNDEAWKCGEEAKALLSELVDDKRVECENRKKEKYGRFLSVCRVGDIVLNDEMVRRGYAVAYMVPDYVDAEEEAKLSQVGAWAGEFVLPDEWRKRKRQKMSSL